MFKTCCVEGCSGPINARDMCSKHYMQQRRAGLLPIGTRARGTTEERLWRHVDKAGDCWIWTGKSVNQKGYGQIQIGGRETKQKLVHRLSYEIHYGEIPEGMVVMHSCDNPSCVNPDHLSVGTQSQNILDAFARGRKTASPPHKQGESHGASKLKEGDVLTIRSSKTSNQNLALFYGVSNSAIERIRNRKTWRHI